MPPEKPASPKTIDLLSAEHPDDAPADDDHQEFDFANPANKDAYVVGFWPGPSWALYERLVRVRTLYMEKIDAERDALSATISQATRADTWGAARRIVNQFDDELRKMQRRAERDDVVGCAADPIPVEMERQTKFYQDAVGSRAFVDPDYEFDTWGRLVKEDNDQPGVEGRGRPATPLDEKERRVLAVLERLDRSAARDAERSGNRIARACSGHREEVSKILKDLEERKLIVNKGTDKRPAYHTAERTKK